MHEVLQSLGVIQGSPSQTRLVTPYADGLKVFSSFLGTAKTTMKTMIYSATLPVFFNDVIAAKARGVQVKVIFDHSQSEGHAEHPQILQLIKNGFKDGEDFIVGTSPVHDQIIHIKSTWIDGRWVEDGSFNYSQSALAQINTICISDWPEYAAFLDTLFQLQWDWILKHESRYNSLTN